MFLVFGSVGVWGQQVIGSFPYMDGGFEGQVTGGLGNALSATAWSRQSQTGASSTIITTTPRTGLKYSTITNVATTSRGLQSPQTAIPANGPQASTSYTIQYFIKNPIITGYTESINTNGTTSTAYGAPVTVAANASWTKRTVTQTSATTAVSTAGILVTARSNSAVTFDIDDVVLYAGAVDNTAPNSPGTVTVNNPTSSTLDVSWLVAPSGVDGGGYVVVRYAALPGATDDPLQNGIYAVGNTVPGAVNGTVVYIGTGLSFTDAGLTGSTTYYYKVYTVDKAFNYSAESEGNGTTTVNTTPDILLSSPNPAVPAANIAQGSTNNPIYRFDLAVTTADATLNGVTITTAGSYVATDITNFKCWYSADNIFTTAEYLISLAPTILNL